MNELSIKVGRNLPDELIAYSDKPVVDQLKLSVGP